jgi:DNA-binding transcriptional regulator of glucitol operon
VRRVLAPKWLAWHALALVVAVAFVRLGLWQWHRAVATRSPQNMGYALQWPAFALFAIAMWWRVVRDAVRPPGDRPTRRAHPPRRSHRRPLPEPAPTVPVTDEEDPELAAYNRYLAELATASDGLPSEQSGTASDGLPSEQSGTASDGLPSEQSGTASDGWPSEQSDVAARSRGR